MLFLPIPLEVDLDCASSFAFLGVTRLQFLLLPQVHNIYLQSYAVFCIEHHVMTVAFQLFFQGTLYHQSTAFGTNKPQVLSIHIPLNYTIYRGCNQSQSVGDSFTMLVTNSSSRRTLVIFVTNIDRCLEIGNLLVNIRIFHITVIFSKCFSHFVS